jgi:hypothetical protein
MSLLDNLNNIINTKEIRPTIINEASRFVIVTYWWGRNAMNQNTSRPCISFFEKIITRVQKLCIKALGSASNTDDVLKIYERLTLAVPNLADFKRIINETTEAYNNMIFEHLGILPNAANKDENAAEKLQKLKELRKVPEDFEYKNKEYAERMFTIIMTQVVSIITDNCFIIFNINRKVAALKADVLSKEKQITEAEKEHYLEQIGELNNVIQIRNAAIKTQLNTKQTYTNPLLIEFNDMSIYEILRKEFRFLNPITFNEMIDKWEAECTTFKCNHMAVEYPEFTRPGGYQLAINAKPLFIKKALDAVQASGRAVLYIDGDMYIRKYPKIFDLPDVDFMARGWWIDPRSSWKMEESITYDPYTFETSGGTMMFSQSSESKRLISKWIEQASKPYQIGKADDRILSLVFNTYKFLCSMKIIQLPIEYLWLSLDYDERMLGLVYDYDKYKMTDSIIIEHPECLTSEDTATGGGAASSRTPKFYDFLEENIDPVSEQFHEYMMFPTKDMVETFQSYLTYMSGVHYVNDGNPILIQKKFIDLEDTKKNEQPLYITKYSDKFGNLKYPYDTSLTYNQVGDINTRRAIQMNISGLGLVPMVDNPNIIEINDLSKLMKEDDPTKYDNAKIISLIIKLLLQRKQVIYNPKTMPEYNKLYYDLLLQDSAEKLKSMELIFVPRFTEGASTTSNYFFKPRIQTNQAMMFRPNNILIKFLMMFLSLDNMSSYLNNGSYEMMSRVRVGYLINKQKRVAPSVAEYRLAQKFPNLWPESRDILADKPLFVKLGGSVNTNADIDLYNEGIDILYKGGGRRYRRPLYLKRRSFKKMTRKIQRVIRKSMQKKRPVKRRKSSKTRRMSIKRAAKRTYKK